MFRNILALSLRTYPTRYVRIIGIIITRCFIELVRNGSSLQLSLVRRIGRSENVRANRVPTVSKTADRVWGEIFQRLVGFVRLGETHTTLDLRYCYTVTAV